MKGVAYVDIDKSDNKWQGEEENVGEHIVESLPSKGGGFGVSRLADSSS